MTEQRAPDRQIAVGVALGWHMLELYQARLPKQPSSHSTPDRRKLPSLVSWSDLSLYERASVYFEQVESDIRTLHLFQASQSLTPLVKQLRACFKTVSDTNRDDFNQAMQTLHVELITCLTAEDPRLGKAYRLGFAMSETAILPVRFGRDQFKEMFNEYRLGTVSGWLVDLKSCLPDHSSEASQASLKAWGGWYAGVADDAAMYVDQSPEKGRVERALRQQGEHWRALLTGEKRAIDVLTPADYVQAAGDMVTQIASLVFKFLKTPAGYVLLGLLASIVVVSLVLVVLGIASSAIAWGIAVLGAFGITAASVGAAVQKAVTPVQQALWQADLTGAIARAATHLPTPKRTNT